MGILDVLSYLDRPRNALANALYENAYDPQGSFTGGLWRGLTGDQERFFGDLVGISAPNETDPWSTWLAKGGSRLALDILGDPLNLVFGGGAIGKGTRYLARPAAEAVGLTKLTDPITNATSDALRGLGEAYASGKIPLLGETPVQLFGGKGNPEWFGGKMGELQDAYARRMRDGSTQDILNAANKAAQEQKSYLASSGDTPLSLFHMLEARAIAPEAESYAKAAQPLRESAAQNAQRIIDWGNETGNKALAKQLLDELDQTYMPHMLTESGQRSAGIPKRLGDLAYDPNVELPSRQIMNWVDEQGIGVTIGKLNDKRTGVTGFKDPVTGNTRYYYGGLYDPKAKILEGGEQVFPSQATLSQKVSEFPGLEWATDPTAVLYQTAKSRQQQVNFINLFDDLKKQGLLRSAEEIPANQVGDWRALRLPGFEHLEAPKWAANWLENQTSGHFGFPTTSRNMIEDLAMRYGDSQFANALADVTQNWRRNVLAWPGWIFGNTLSNMASLQQARQFSPTAMKDVIKGLSGKEGAAIEGLGLQDFISQMADRGIRGSGQAV